VDVDSLTENDYDMTMTEPDHLGPLRDSVTEFITRGTDIARARRLRETDPGYERSTWNQLAELGWLGILVPEDHGGMGLGFTEMRVVLEGLARVLTPEPVLAGAVMAAGLLRQFPQVAICNDLLQALATGACVPALAWQERTGSLDLATQEATLRAHNGSYRLAGTKHFVHGVPGADGYIVSAEGGHGLALVWVAADTQGITLERLPLADGRTMASLMFADVEVSREHLIAVGVAAIEALERTIDEALVMAGAELCGVMYGALDMTLEHLRTRSQFGKPIGSFQALAHRAVDLYIQQQLSVALVDEAVALLDAHPKARERAVLASRVKARCSDAALRLTREAIPLHGAMGFTDEFNIGLYLKRAMVLSAWLGNAALHRRRYARLIESVAT